MGSIASMWWIVALEAASFFSLTTWMFAVDRAWPADNPREFAAAVLLGATAATLLCHVAPALWGRRTAGLTAGRLARWLTVPLVAWLLAGAGVSFEELARGIGGMWTLPHAWDTAAAVVATACAITAAALVWGRTSWQRVATLLCLALGMGVVSASFVAQWHGLWAHSELLVFDDARRVSEGVVLAAAPAAILAVRIGKKSATVRQVCLTGLAGMWLPLVMSVTLGSLAKMGGVRLLHYHGSWHLGFEQALLFTSNIALTRTTLIFAGLTLLTPCWISAIWIRDLMEPLNWTHRAVVTVLAAGVVYYWFPLTNEGAWLNGPEYENWCWSVVVLGPLLAMISFFLRRPRAC